ncbi:MAG: immunoglobulin domain-containing protein [Verrucomicrobia bacterium]|nr:immunoglobulin domain-containing protein [Verrucomicrobiota bacterium]
MSIANVQPADAGDYLVVVSNSVNSVTSQVATLTVLSKPIIVQQPAARLVGQGDDATFTVVAIGPLPLSYQWSSGTNPIDGATGDSYTVTGAQPADAGNYSVVVTNIYGATNSAAAALTVTAVPVITSQPQGLLAAQGTNVLFAVAAVGGAPLIYQWSKGAAPISSETNATLALNNVQPGDAGNYSVLVSNSFGVTNSVGAALNIYARPGISTPPVGTNLVVGATLTMNVVATGSAPLSYRWRINFQNLNDSNNITGSTNATLVISSVLTNHGGLYDVVVSNAYGFTNSATALVNVFAPPVLTIQPSNRTGTIGSNTTFSVGVTGTAPFAYQWHFNGDDLTGRTNSTLSLTNLQATNAGSYNVRVSNPYGSTNSAQAQLTVATVPTITLQPTNRSIVQGKSTTFTVSVAGSVPLSYQWFFNSNALAGKTTYQLALTNVQASNVGDYTVRITNVFGTTNSATATLTLVSPPTILTQPVDQSVGLGSNALFSVTASGTGPIGYRWKFNGLTLTNGTGSNLVVSNITITNSGSYSVTVTNPAGSTNSTTATLFLDLPFLPFTDDFSNHVTTNSFSGLGRGTNLTATREPGEPAHGGSVGAHSVWLGWVAPASGAATIATTGSDFDTLLGVYTGTNLTNLAVVASDDDGGGFLTSRAAFNAVGGEEYVIAVDALNAGGNLVLAWNLDTNIADLPQITTQPVSQIVPLSNSVTFTVGATSLSPLSYQWYKNFSPMSGRTNPALTISNVNSAATGYYRARVSNTNGLVDSTPATLEVSVAAGNISRDKFSTLLTNPPSLVGFGGKRPSAGGPLISGSQVLDNTGATTEPGERNHGGVVGGASRWTFIDSPGNGTMRVDTEGSLLDTVLAVYTGTDFSNLVLIAEDNNSGSDGFTSLVRFAATAGTRYLVAVDGVNGVQGEIHLNWSFGDAPLAGFSASNRVAAFGESIEFTPAASGSEPLGYQWLLNGSPIGAATNPALPLAALSNSAAGVYSLVLSNPLGVTTNQFATLSLFSLDFVNGGARVQIAGPPGNGYQVDVANLLGTGSNWNALTNLFLPLSPFFILDDSAAGLTNRFYRLNVAP